MTETQIIRDATAFPGEAEIMDHWSMVIDGTVVAELWTEIGTGQIMQVETDPGHRRLGYASALYRAAACEISIYHAPVGHRTPEGNAFAAGVGGEALPCLYGCCE